MKPKQTLPIDAIAWRRGYRAGTISTIAAVKDALEKRYRELGLIGKDDEDDHRRRSRKGR